jgi:peroxisomal enoyl-CoA hydratase 2
MPEFGVGFEYPPTEVSWLKRDVLLFANTVGCTADELHFLYVRRLECPASPRLPVERPLFGSSC